MITGPGNAIRIGRLVALALAAALLAGCATTSALRDGRRAERERDYDEAVVRYRRAVQERPNDRDAQLALERAMLRAAQQHYAQGPRAGAAVAVGGGARRVPDRLRG